MRDPDRIPRILGKLQKLWAHQPDVRLGQLVANLVMTTGKSQFYTEDNDAERAIVRALNDAGARSDGSDRGATQARQPSNAERGEAMAISGFDSVKTFSATKSADRDQLGERVTAWLAEHPEVTVVETVVTQSSDNSFHALCMTLFLRASGNQQKGRLP